MRSQAERNRMQIMGNAIALPGKDEFEVSLAHSLVALPECACLKIEGHVLAAQEGIHPTMHHRLRLEMPHLDS